MRRQEAESGTNGAARTSMAAGDHIGELGEIQAWDPILCSAQKSILLSGSSSNNYDHRCDLLCGPDGGTRPKLGAGRRT